jgi:hypothetical protein
VLSFYNQQGYGTYVTYNGTAVAIGNNGGAGQDGQSTGSAEGGTKGTLPPEPPNGLVSQRFEGLSGSGGQSTTYPNSNVPVGGIYPQFGGYQMLINGVAGGLGAGQRYSAFYDQDGNLIYPASPYTNFGCCIITWYIAKS